MATQAEVAGILRKLALWYPNAHPASPEMVVEWQKELADVPLVALEEAIQAWRVRRNRFFPSLPEMCDLARPTALQYPAPTPAPFSGTAWLTVERGMSLHPLVARAVTDLGGPDKLEAAGPDGRRLFEAHYRALLFGGEA